MLCKFKEKLGLERPPDPLRVAAGQLFARHEAKLLAQLETFIQEQMERPILSHVVEAEVMVIEVQPVYPDRTGQGYTSRQTASQSYSPVGDSRFRQWQAEVFTYEAELKHDSSTIESYLHRLEDDPGQGAA
jgi:hypothetical protein